MKKISMHVLLFALSLPVMASNDVFVGSNSKGRVARIKKVVTSPQVKKVVGIIVGVGSLIVGTKMYIVLVRGKKLLEEFYNKRYFGGCDEGWYNKRVDWGAYRIRRMPRKEGKEVYLVKPHDNNEIALQKLWSEAKTASFASRFFGERFTCSIEEVENSEESSGKERVVQLVFPSTKKEKDW